jgi:hypothetical protein
MRSTATVRVVKERDREGSGVSAPKRPPMTEGGVIRREKFSGRVGWSKPPDNHSSHSYVYGEDNDVAEQKSI